MPLGEPVDGIDGCDHSPSCLCCPLPDCHPQNPRGGRPVHHWTAEEDEMVMAAANNYRELQAVAGELRIEYKTVLSHRRWMLKRGCAVEEPDAFDMPPPPRPARVRLSTSPLTISPMKVSIEDIAPASAVMMMACSCESAEFS